MYNASVQFLKQEFGHALSTTIPEELNEIKYLMNSIILYIFDNITYSSIFTKLPLLLLIGVIAQEFDGKNNLFPSMFAQW